MLSVVLPRWVDVVSTNFASLLFMPWFMLYLHISHVLCLQLPSICTQFNRPPDTSVHIYLPLVSWTPSFSRFLQRQVNRKHSFNMIAMMLYSPCLKRTVCVGQPKPGQAEHPPLWLKPAGRLEELNVIMSFKGQYWRGIIRTSQYWTSSNFVPFPRPKVSFAVCKPHSFRNMIHLYGALRARLRSSELGLAGTIGRRGTH